MDKDNNRISIRQFAVIFLMSIASPVIRVIPRYSAETAKSASWIMPFFTSIFFLILLFILYKIICGKDSKSLEDVLCEVFGKIIGKILMVIYFIWIIVIISTYLRYFADRMTSSIYVASSNKFFIFTMLMVVYFTVRNEIKFFARYIEFSILLVAVFFIITFGVAIPSIKIENLFPVTTNDTLNILESTLPFMGILSYITFMFFLGDKISNKQEFKKHFTKLTVTIFCISLMVILVTVGIFGYKLTYELNLPFFAFFKNIQILEIIERFEAVLITTWIITDYSIITTFTFIAMKLIQKIFNTNSSRELITPILFITYIVSLYLGSNLFEMISFSKYLFLPVNNILGIGMPILVLIVGKIRKKI